MPVKAKYGEAYNWAGFYAGGNVGYGSSSRPADFLGVVFNGTVSSTLTGVFGGVQGGYNWQISSWVVGLEADYQWSGMKGVGTGTVGGAATLMNTRATSFGTVRGRVGVTPASAWLVYITGGFAYVTHSGELTVGAVVAPTDRRTTSGWTSGLGVETFLAPQWTAKIEYLYIKPVDAMIGQVNVHTTTNVVRVGANYHF